MLSTVLSGAAHEAAAGHASQDQLQSLLAKKERPSKSLTLGSRFKFIVWHQSECRVCRSNVYSSAAGAASGSSASGAVSSVELLSVAAGCELALALV